MPKIDQRGLIHLLLPLVVLVLLGAGAYYFLVMQKSTPPTTNNTISQKNPQTTTTSQPLFLTLESPNDSSTVVDDTIVIKGKTLPNTTVTMYNDTDDAMVQSDTSGSFESKLLLGAGENNLTITAFGENGEEKTLTLKMTYNPS